MEEEFFLPDLCQAQSILFLVLVAELLVFVLVLARSSFIDFSWIDLGISSLFVQWIVLCSAAVLCNIRPLLVGKSAFLATVIGYAIILALTLIFSLLGQWIMLILEGEEAWGARQNGIVIRNLLIAAVMGGIAFRYFFLQHQLRQREQAELNSRIQALQSRIRPHFLFNSMNIIASLIPVDPEKAEIVVEDLSVLFRASLNDSSDKPVLLEEEIQLCQKYLHIESLRLDDRLTVDWQLAVDPTGVKIPMLTLQPLLENAIYHGIQPLPGGGMVKVEIWERDGKVFAVITNPLGPDNHSHVKGNRMALDNIRRRLEAIYGEAASVTTERTESTFKSSVTFPAWPAKL
ncbi:MAG: histidine kinase [Pseudomonadales bacterium]|nr:histidine kinase [Pseudomonadales bacterium]